MDSIIYQINRNVFDICKDEKYNTQCLLFKNTKYKISFMYGSMTKGNNCCVIDSVSGNIHYLDSVILSKEYFLKNDFKANEKLAPVLKKYKK